MRTLAGDLALAASVMLAFVFLVGCSQQPLSAPMQQPITPPPAPSVPTTEPTTAPTGSQPTTAPGTMPSAQGTIQLSNATAGLDKIVGTVNTTTALDINSVRCDNATKTITFRFVNDDVKSWQMNEQVPFPAPQNLSIVRVFVNNYEVNGGQPYYQNGALLFGSQKFSADCGGVEVLNPGQDATCTISPVPLNQVTSYAGVNQIFIDSPTSHQVIQFTC